MKTDKNIINRESEGLVIGGTTEARQVIEALNRAGVSLTVCVATKLGRDVLKDAYGISTTRICVGRKDRQGFEDILSEISARFVIDASHPFAVEVSKNIQAAAHQMHIPCVRYVRNSYPENEKYTYVRNAGEAVAALEKMPGNILLTTGVNTAAAYAKGLRDFNTRAYIRVLDTPASLQLCQKAGICPSHVIAAMPPFTLEDNLSLIKKYQIGILVTKECGDAGGLEEKLKSADLAGIQALIIQRPEEDTGDLAMGHIDDLIAWVRGVMSEKVL